MIRKDSPIIHIAAISKNHVIGVNGDLPWKLSEDLKFFKKNTSGHCIIMGRKTFESIGKALPNRVNVVITRNKKYTQDNAFCFNKINDAIDFCQRNHTDKKIFIIGGGQIYKSTIDIASKLILTEVDTHLEGDAFYPNFKENFKLVSSDPQSNDSFSFAFNTYERV